MTIVLATGNSYAQLYGAPSGLIEVLRYDLSYAAPDAIVPTADDGWDGYIRLMRRDGAVPAGLVPELRRLLTKYGVEHVFRDMREPVDDELPLWSGIGLRDYQKRLVDIALEKRRGVIVAPPRSGKTMMGEAIVDANPLPTLWTAPTKAIVRQTVASMKRHLKLGPDDIVEVIGGWPKSPSKHRRIYDARVVVTTAAGAVGFPHDFLRQRRRWVVDEFHHCLEPSQRVLTYRGWTPISDVREGDLVAASIGGVVRWRAVRRVWRRPAPALWLRIETTAGTLEVTDEHKVYTPSGKVRAGDLREGSAVHLLEVQEEDPAEGAVRQSREGVYGPEETAVVPALRPRVPEGDETIGDRRARGGVLGEQPARQSRDPSACDGDALGEPGVSGALERTNAREEHDAVEGVSGAHDDVVQEGDRRGTCGGVRPRGRREGPRADVVGAGDVEDPSPDGLRARARDQDRAGEGRRRDLVPGGFRASREDGRGGSGRFGSRESCGTGRGEGRVLGVDGVDGSSGSVVERRGRGSVVEGKVLRVEAVAARSAEVFDLEVDEAHNYFAEGVLVSNSAANTYQELNVLCDAVYERIGLTGTYFRSDPNTEILMDAVLSEVIGRIEVQQLVDLGYLCPVDFLFVPIQGPVIPDRMGLDVAYRMGILQHANRNDWIAWCVRILMEHGRRVLVLVKLIEHGEKLAAKIPGSQFVRGADKDFTDDDVAAAIAAFNSGKVQCLVGTSVLGEGIDLPAADALVYAKGGSASVTVTQDVFRVLTATQGKARSIVIDFADRHSDVLLTQSAARGRIYAAEPCFNVEVLATPQAAEPAVRRLLGHQTLI